MLSLGNKRVDGKVRMNGEERREWKRNWRGKGRGRRMDKDREKNENEEELIKREGLMWRGIGKEREKIKELK